MERVLEFFWAPLMVGFILWTAAEGVRWWFSQVAQRRARRRRVISLMGRAHAVAFRAIRDGVFDRAYASGAIDTTSAERTQYDDLAAEALDLFEVGEEAVAMWTAVEFYAGWTGPFFQAHADGVPRELPERGRIFSVQAPMNRWQLARPTELADWADVMWPWDRGNARGPRYGHASAIGDTTRHEVVTPNSDANGDILRPWVLLHGGDPWPKPSRREMRRLVVRYPDWDANLYTSQAQRRAAMEKGRQVQQQINGHRRQRSTS
ncbi:hypothetical protein [Microbacterium sp. NPDC055683]